MIRRTLAAIALLAAVATGQGIRRAEWGFDGAVVPGRFNLLSVLVDNPTADPLDTELVLTRRSNLGGQLGAPIVVPCFVSPRSQRWFQLTPYVTSRRQPWSLRFTREELAGYDVPRPAAGNPALVLLDTVAPETALSYLLPIYPTERFPTALAATAGLGAVVLDRAPEWERARRVTFLDWVRLGGTVHLMRGFGGWPRFGEGLEELNGPGEVVRVGDGRVVRHDFTRTELQLRIPKELEVAPPGLGDGVESAVFAGLQEQVRISREWMWINLLALVYFVAVGPWVFHVARRTASWTRTLGTLALVIAVASVLFSIAGSRGVSDAALLRTLTLARPLDDGRWSTLQFANAFVARGGEYTIAADGDQDVFSTAQVFEPVRGTIRQGRDAGLVVDIPQSSWRTFLHQRVVAAGPVRVTAADGPWKPGARRLRLALELAEDAPVRALRYGVCTWNGMLFPLRVQGTTATGFGGVQSGGAWGQAVAQLPLDVSEPRAASAGSAALVAAVAADHAPADAVEDRVVVYLVGEPRPVLADAIEGFGDHQGLAMVRVEIPLGEEGR